jgi:parallel beta-helix repeat protein
MRKSKTVWLGVLLALALLLGMAPVFSTATPATAQSTIYVPDDYTTIQAAVDAAVAGDTIIVRDGTYTENVLVDESLTIRSENGWMSTLVQAAATNNDVLRVEAAGVTIDGFSVTGATSYGRAGIRPFCSSASSCTIINNYCAGNNIGISLDPAGGGNTIADNTCEANSDYGIKLSNTTSNTVTGNTCTNTGQGIGLWDNAVINNVYGNTCDSNSKGIRVKNADSNAIFKNNFSNNDIGLEMATGSIGNTFYLNNFTDNATQINHIFNSVSGNFWNSQEQIDYMYGGTSYTSFMGNYWDDYAGTDADGDGIGDSGYLTKDEDDGGDDGIEYDYYPLMGPFEQYFPFSSTTLSGEVPESYASITVPDYLDVPLERGTTVVVSGAVDIDSNIPWQLDVEDEKTDDKGYMVSTEGDVLQHPMMVNHDATSIDLSTPGGGTLATGAGPESVAVEFSQEVEYTDPAGTYEITVTFSVFGAF